MGKLADLLKYRTSVVLRDEIKNEDLYEVWVRLLGDEDLKEAFKFARIASSKKRKELQKPDSLDREDLVGQLAEQTREDLIDIILAAQEQAFSTEATVVVDREELPDIESIAKLPDAPTLAEQERLDALLEEQEDAYNKKINEYIEIKSAELRDLLGGLSQEDLASRALDETITIEALKEFLAELTSQKVYRGTYDDKLCKKLSFDDIDEYRNANTFIKQQLINAYNSLEVNGDEIKN